MARLATGIAHIEAARALVKSATTADELRQAQSVLLPLEHKLSISQTAAIIGRSVGVTCSMRTRFARVADGVERAPRKKTELRNRAHADLTQESAALDAVLNTASVGGVVIIPRLKADIEAKLGSSVSLSGLYRMLHRHGWRKLAPDTRHPQGDAEAREAWKKNSPRVWSKS